MEGCGDDGAKEGERVHVAPPGTPGRQHRLRRQGPKAGSRTLETETGQPFAQPPDSPPGSGRRTPVLGLESIGSRSPGSGSHDRRPIHGSGAAGARTLDLRIKSPLLYRLSYSPTSILQGATRRATAPDSGGCRGRAASEGSDHRDPATDRVEQDAGRNGARRRMREGVGSPRRLRGRGTDPPPQCPREDLNLHPVTWTRT